LPAQAKTAVHYLTTFAWRELTGTILHSKEYANVFKTRQQVLSGTKLQDDVKSSDSWTEDVHPWSSATERATSTWYPPEQVSTTVPTVEATEGMKDAWLPITE
jgi:hypothetical protein